MGFNSAIKVLIEEKYINLQWHHRESTLRLLIFHYNNGYLNRSHWHGTHTLPVLHIIDITASFFNFRSFRGPSHMSAVVLVEILFGKLTVTKDYFEVPENVVLLCYPPNICSLYNFTKQLTGTRKSVIVFNSLTPNNHYSGRTAPLTSRRCI
jgi:hypothetical protein